MQLKTTSERGHSGQRDERGHRGSLKCLGEQQSRRHPISGPFRDPLGSTCHDIKGYYALRHLSRGTGIWCAAGQFLLTKAARF